MTEELTKLREALRRVKYEAVSLADAQVIALEALTAAQSAQAGEREAWVPYLVDRADGVKGHYAIGRWNPRGYREVWNLHSHRWAAYSDDVMSLDEADSLLRQITIPTVRASLPTQPAAQATPEPTTPEPLGYIPTDAIDQIKTPPRLITHKVPVLSYAAEGYTAIYTRPAPGVPMGDGAVQAMWSLFAGTNTVMRVDRAQFGALVQAIEKLALAAAQAKGGDHA